MVENITSLTRNGLKDWFVQRITAIILGLYVIFLFGYFIAHPQLQYSDWQALFTHNLMRVFSFLALLSVVAHSWIGIWTIFTDYIKCAAWRLALTILMILALLVYLVWGVEILWR